VKLEESKIWKGSQFWKGLHEAKHIVKVGLNMWRAMGRSLDFGMKYG
jgi:hypothetical protein